jgi:secondary thiamine-phosphate synthase enzyme
MKFSRHQIVLTTTEPIQVIDITAQVRALCVESGVGEGLLTLTCPHTTARLNLNERDAMLQQDMVTFLERLVPRDGDYLHNLQPVDDRDNAHAHLLGLFMNSSESLPIVAGRPWLGGWQSIFFIELDGPRAQREVRVQILGAEIPGTTG